MGNLKMEVLPSPQELARTPVLREEVLRLVQQGVAEEMAKRDAMVFEPWFRSRQTAYEYKRLQSVPEQEVSSVCYERYGCIDCKTHDRPHGGNGFCQNCRAKWFRRRTQAIKEGINGEHAQRARGTARAERLLPENAPQDGVHRTWFEPSKRNTKEENAIYARVAKRLRLKPSYVTSIARGWRVSAPVSAAIEEERIRQRLLPGSVSPSD